jgi:DNA-binding winged helix-turn-helix (wHTH) protein
LRRAGAPVELSNRYFDALALLLGEAGQLVSKDRFMAEVWRGVPVTDEALTQCIKTLRRQLGDDATAPRFIETVPKHGYRFIAPVLRQAQDERILRQARDERVEVSGAPLAVRGELVEPCSAQPSGQWPAFWLTGAAGALGGGAAGLLGGVLYGFAASAPAMGAGTLLLVMMALTAAIGLAGGAGVGFGVAGAAFVPRSSSAKRGSATMMRAKWQWPVFGGMAGGVVVGALAKLLGIDAFNLLFGHAPSDMTGAREGLLLGAAVGLGAWLARDTTRLGRGFACGALTGGAAGALVPLLGGHLLGGSLDLLARQFPDSQVRLAPIGRLLGEHGFGPLSQTVTGAFEGAVFGAGVVGALVLARRWRR